MLAFFFLTEVVTLNWRGAGVFRGKGRFAVDDGGRHGGVDWISTRIAVGYSTEYVGYR